MKAISAARLAKFGGSNIVTLDDVVTMASTGRDMMTKYEETSMGGLAVQLGLPVDIWSASGAYCRRSSRPSSSGMKIASITGEIQRHRALGLGFKVLHRHLAGLELAVSEHQGGVSAGAVCAFHRTLESAAAVGHVGGNAVGTKFVDKQCHAGLSLIANGNPEHIDP